MAHCDRNDGSRQNGIVAHLGADYSTSYYGQKTFWSLCSYMVRSYKGIEMMVNLINISYCAMKILPYEDEHFAEYHTKSVQDFRFKISQGIRSQIFFATLVKKSKRT